MIEGEDRELEWTEPCGKDLLELAERYIQEGCITPLQVAIIMMRLAEHFLVYADEGRDMDEDFRICE